MKKIMVAGGAKSGSVAASEEPTVVKEKQTAHRRPVNPNLGANNPFSALNFGVDLGNPIYFPKRKKLKGWQKENRKYRKLS